MAQIDIGKLTFNHLGDYASGTAYVKNDVVYYNGSAYIAKQSTTGNVPTNATYWSQFSAGSGGIWNSGLSLGSAGQAVLVNAAGNALEFGSGGKATELHVFADDNVGTVSSSGNFISWNFTPTISGKVFLAHSGAHRAQSSSHYYCRYYFNNGSGEVAQHEQGFGFAPSQNTHNQGWAVSFLASTGGDADSTTPMTVTANTQCNFRANNKFYHMKNSKEDKKENLLFNELISHMIEENLEKRYNINDVMNHQFFNNVSKKFENFKKVKILSNYELERIMEKNCDKFQIIDKYHKKTFGNKFLFKNITMSLTNNYRNIEKRINENKFNFSLQ